MEDQLGVTKELSTDFSETEFERFCLAQLSPLSRETEMLHFAPQKRPWKPGSCKCQKSRCLKLYCECFASGDCCGPLCSCKGCMNKTSRAHLRKKAMTRVLAKNPAAFSGENVGCNCLKSECQKLYCECLHNGVLCTPLCQCINCKNADHTCA